MRKNVNSFQMVWDSMEVAVVEQESSLWFL